MKEWISSVNVYESEQLQLQKTRAFDAAEGQRDTEGMRKKNREKGELRERENEGGTAEKRSK